MRISFSIEITRDSGSEPEEITQPDMSGANIELSGQWSEPQLAVDRIVREVGFRSRLR